jgi:hypothetical protein
VPTQLDWRSDCLRYPPSCTARSPIAPIFPTLFVRARTRTRQVFFVFCLHRFTRWAQMIEQQCFVGEAFGEVPSPSGEDRENAKAFTPNIQ